MYEAIVTLVFPAEEKFVPGSGALLSRDRYEQLAPGHTEVYRLEWKTREDMLAWLDTSCHEGLVAEQEMGHSKVVHQ